MSPRASSIERLPPDILEKLHALLRDPRVTQLEATARINAILAEDGSEERVSKSAVNRYAVKMDEVGERIRESRQVAEMWIAKLGAAPQGQIGHLVNETLRTLAFDLSHKLMSGELNEESMPGTIKMLKEMSLSIMRLERASSENMKREQEIRSQERERVADAVGEEAKAQGMTDEQARFWRQKVLGVA